MSSQLTKLATILTLILLSTSLNAQVDSTNADRGVNINFFNGYALSYKWNASQSMNYRVYLGMSSSYSGDNYDTEYKYGENPKRTGEGTDNGKHFRMNLSFQFLFNIISQKSFNLYLGIGPNFSYYYTNYDQNENYDDNSSYENSGSNSLYGVGVVSLFGIEAYLSPTVTLFAETHLTGSKSWTNYTYTSYNKNNDSDYSNENSRTGSSWNANLQLVKVGLGIYF